MLPCSHVYTKTKLRILILIRHQENPFECNRAPDLLCQLRRQGDKKAMPQEDMLFEAVETGYFF
jgi:hypothetical protein